MFEVNFWRGDCLSVEAARERHEQARERRTIVPFHPDVDGMLAWLVKRFPKLAERPWRAGLLGFSDIALTPDVFAGYASIGVIWPEATTVGREIVAEARARGLTVFLPDGPPEVGASVLCEGDADLPAAYWEGLSLLADEFHRRINALDPSIVRIDTFPKP